MLFVPLPAALIVLVALVDYPPALSTLAHEVVPTWMLLIYEPKYVKFIISSMFSKHFAWLSTKGKSLGLLGSDTVNYAIPLAEVRCSVRCFMYVCGHDRKWQVVV